MILVLMGIGMVAGFVFIVRTKRPKPQPKFKDLSKVPREAVAIASAMPRYRRRHEP